jgi:hypothetical protein
MKHRFGLLSCSASAFLVFALAAAACGGISDPTRGGEERVATVSGALTGSAVPANARVALLNGRVTRTGANPNAVEVGADVPVIGGKFTMNLGVPAEDYFSSVESYGTDSNPPPALRESPVPSSPGTGSNTSGGGAFGQYIGSHLSPRDLAGGAIVEELSAAIAGFVVYVDANGNGKLDVEGPYASSPDQVIGGNNTLSLTYLRGGGTLAYEQRRDKSGILPVAGFNLWWSDGRWLPLNLVELALTTTARLPSAVCRSTYSSRDEISGTKPSPPPVLPRGEYPSPTDPLLTCSNDGRSFMYLPPSNCPSSSSAPAPVGLCADGADEEAIACRGGAYRRTIDPGAPVPIGWPCPVMGELDAGSFDASFDGGAADGG